MITSTRYVIDTCALISYYKDVFKGAAGYKGSPVLSKGTTNIIHEAIYHKCTQYRLSIPNIVFIEIYEKWLRTEEFCRKFFYDVFTPLRASDNIEIRPTDKEVLENLLCLNGQLANHDIHDRIVLASAMALNAPLITMDQKISSYVTSTHIIPEILC